MRCCLAGAIESNHRVTGDNLDLKDALNVMEVAHHQLNEEKAVQSRGIAALHEKVAALERSLGQVRAESAERRQQLQQAHA